MIKITKNESKLDVLIVKSGYTITKFAKKIGISKYTMMRILNNYQNLSPELAKKICDVLGCSFDTIFVTTED